MIYWTSGECLKNDTYFGQTAKMSTIALIQQKIEQLPEGTPFTASTFLALGTRAAVDKALQRLCASHLIKKSSRGIYYRPEKSRWGELPVESEELAKLKAGKAVITVHGAEAVRRFGLSTQMPVQPVFYTTGRSCSFYNLKMPVKLIHISPRKIVHPGTNVGTAITALWYMGKHEVNNEVFETIRKRLTPKEYKTLQSSASQMPGWMADGLRKYERSRSKK